MTAQEQISKLQGLLARIQRNATRPRTGAALPPPAAFAPPPAIPAAPPPTALVAAAPIPMPASAPTAFAPPPAPALSAADQALDELLESAPLPATGAADFDAPFDSIPPVPEETRAASEPVEAEPIPLVNTATHEPLPAAPADESFSLESEVSEVRMAPLSREPAADVTLAAIAAEAEPEPIAAEELSEDDLVEVTEGTPIAAEVDVEVQFSEEDEEPPASSQRSRVASTMDEALAAAAEQLDTEHDVLIKTPPPESGPQEAPTTVVTFNAAEMEALLGEELPIPTRETPPVPGPTAEQLGQTIDLDEGRGPSLELAEHQGQTAAAARAAVEELEIALPAREAHAGYDDELQPPPEALSELEAHRRRMEEEDIPPPPESLAQLPSVEPRSQITEIVPVELAGAVPLGPEIVARPIPAGTPEVISSLRESFRPASFLELLDASLALQGD